MCPTPQLWGGEPIWEWGKERKEIRCSEQIKDLGGIVMKEEG